MNKIECVKFCENKIKEMWNKYGNPTDYNTRHNTYLHCKDVCKTNGYIGNCFMEIWNKASDNAYRNKIN